MPIKYIYQGVEHITESNHIKLNTNNKLLRDDVDIESQGVVVSGYNVQLIYYNISNDIDIFWTINGVSHQIDKGHLPIGQHGYAQTYEYPPMTNVETISFDADHYSTGYSTSDSWFAYRSLGGSEPLTFLSRNQVLTLTGDIELHFGFGSCLAYGTLILMADKTYKSIENIQLGDMVMGYDKKPKKVIKVAKGTKDYRTEYTFDNGTVIKEVNRHRFYNVEHKCMTYLNEWKIGEHGVDIKGNLVALTSIKVVNEETPHATLWCKDNIYYANNLMSGNRHSKKVKL